MNCAANYTFPLQANRQKKEKSIRPIFLRAKRVSRGLTIGAKKTSPLIAYARESDRECPDQKFRTRSRYFSSKFLRSYARHALRTTCMANCGMWRASRTLIVPYDFISSSNSSWQIKLVGQVGIYVK